MDLSELLSGLHLPRHSLCHEFGDCVLELGPQHLNGILVDVSSQCHSRRYPDANSHFESAVLHQKGKLSEENISDKLKKTMLLIYF